MRGAGQWWGREGKKREEKGTGRGVVGSRSRTAEWWGGEERDRWVWGRGCGEVRRRHAAVGEITLGVSGYSQRTYFYLLIGASRGGWGRRGRGLRKVCGRIVEGLGKDWEGLKNDSGRGGKGLERVREGL